MSANAWSYSRLSVFEACKRRFQIQYVEKVPEPPRPLPPGKTEHANDRGTRVHEGAERFVKGGIELLPELKKFEPELLAARDLFAAGSASVEGDWAFTRDWQPTAWHSADVWCRVKCDLVVELDSGQSCVVVDYKTGKRFGNEMKHAEQTQLYVLATLLKKPNARKVTAELWYTDLDELSSMTYTREQGLRLMKNFERRGELLTACEDFPPNPNQFSCRFCPYKPKEKGGTGHCSVGI